MQAIRDVLAEQPDLAGLPPGHLDRLAACSSEVTFAAGEHLGCEGALADACFVLQAGTVGIEVHAPGAGARRLLTLGPGELVGWSWLVPPHRWTADAVAATEVRAVRLDADLLRQACDDDTDLGFRLVRAMAHVAASRLAATRLQLLDLYDHERGPRG